MENKRCLVIADDLTGAADTGVQFVIRGLDTCLISPDGARPIDFSRYRKRDVLVVNTHSRGLNARQASERIALLLKDYRRDPFPLVYKKIDSTLRGNMGSEIDALMEKTGLSDRLRGAFLSGTEEKPRGRNHDGRREAAVAHRGGAGCRFPDP